AVMRLRLFPIGGDNTLAENSATQVASPMSGEAHVLILAKIDVETHAAKKYDVEMSKDEKRYDLKLHKPVIEVFGSSGPSAKVAEPITEPVDAATWTELVGHTTQLPISTPSTTGANATNREKNHSTPRAEEHATGATVSLELQTLITPPPSTEVVSPNTISVPVTTCATVEVSGLHRPRLSC
ncbi:hypothetical protein HAX54_046139, partial [Datura stramonium]|nr:hypothetical protein [Datura stramonium]